MCIRDRRFINIGLVRGGKSGNWNVNGWNIMLRPMLVLDHNEAYADGKEMCIRDRV